MITARSCKLGIANWASGNLSEKLADGAAGAALECVYNLVTVLLGDSSLFN